MSCICISCQCCILFQFQMGIVLRNNRGAISLNYSNKKFSLFACLLCLFPTTAVKIHTSYRKAYTISCIHILFYNGRSVTFIQYTKHKIYQYIQVNMTCISYLFVLFFFSKLSVLQSAILNPLWVFLLFPKEVGVC